MTSIQDLYKDLEPKLAPIINRSARRVAIRLRIDTDDAQQEIRVALFRALEKYDYNRSRGGIYNYAREVVQKSASGLVYRAMRQARVPHVVVDEGGVLKTVPVRNVSLNDVLAEPAVIDDSVEARELADRLRVIKMKMINRLNDRQRAVFSCIAHPTDEFQVFLRNEGAEEPNTLLISKYLGIVKNAVDWSIHQIKRSFTELAEDEFPELMECAIKGAKWPMVFVSHLEQDHDFIREKIQEYQLNTRPSKARQIDRTKDQAALRSIERYDWGTVIELKFGNRAATVVTLGRFNEITGEVLVEGGYWKQLSSYLPWYQELHRALKQEAKKGQK